MIRDLLVSVLSRFRVTITFFFDLDYYLFEENSRSPLEHGKQFFDLLSF